MERRLLYIPAFHIDANLINARQKLSAVNQLEKWFADGVILISMSATAYGEARTGGNEIRTRKANQHIFTTTAAIKPPEAAYKNVETILSPNGAQNENQRNDVRIVCEAEKYGAILVTSDGSSKTQSGGILGDRNKLKSLVSILSPDDAVEFVRQKIQERDELNVALVEEFGGALPD